MVRKETYPTPSLSEITSDVTTADSVTVELFKNVIGVVTISSREHGYYTIDTDLGTARRLAAIEHGMSGNLFDEREFANPIRLQADPTYRKREYRRKEL
ncbi:MAG: hypothetical protein ABI397_00845 [Candidatus Saccharimonas sp.]